MAVRLGTRRGGGAVSAVLLADRLSVLVGLVESGADPRDVAGQLREPTPVRVQPRSAEAHQLDAVLRAVALEEARDVHLDALLGDPEIRRDVLVGLATRDAPEDEVLPRRELALDGHRTKVYGLSVITPST